MKVILCGDATGRAGRNDGPVKVSEKYVYNEQKPSPEHGVKDGRLTLKAEDCGTGRRCEVTYRVLLPRNASVRLRTSGGNVDLALSTAPDEVSGRTSGGDVTIRLPKGSYAVKAETSGGTRKVSVPKDESSAHKVTARTSGGDVSVVTS